MSQSALLKRYAETQLRKLDLELPVFTWEMTEDPIRMNAVFAQNEWEMDSPLIQLNETQDWQHWYACDPPAGTQLEIFFERLEAQVAVAWVYLEMNGRRLVLRETVFRDNSDGHVYSAGGIRLECNAPMRRWRLALNAVMEELGGTNNDCGVHVRLGARAAMVGHTFELPKQSKASFLARVFSHEENIDEAKKEISKCCSRCQAILQPVTLFVELVLDGQREELLLFGSRLKFIGNSKFLRNTSIHVGYAENGTTFTAFRTGERAYGYCCNPQHFVQPIRKGRWTRAPESGQMSASDAGGESLTMSIEGVPQEFLLVTSSNTPIRATDAPASDSRSAAKVVGPLLIKKESHRSLCTVFTICEPQHLPEKRLQELNLLRFPRDLSDEVLLSTSEYECKNPRLTGGKGSSLAILTDISGHLGSFSVPPAIVLTVNAYRIFAELPDVRTAVDELLRDTRGASMTELKIASEKCVSTISESSLPASMSSQLFGKLLEISGSEWESKKFAVRSSAVGEDSEEMSAAGQMTTYLGISGRDEIESAVVRCWASQFALTALNYKRQYGQELNGSMAVVVQEMVKAESAGVMFTCDPVTSNPSDVLITANFGLGESVVSAMADPDTYSLRLVGDEVILKTKTCGVKDRMVVESESGKGTEERTVAPEKAQTFCLTDGRAIELASIGVRLSDLANSPRDIEWAIVQGQIHLLQSRPVTSFLRESDFEIRHDLNAGLYTNREILSRANLDEIMPGVLSPLGISSFIRLAWETFCKVKFTEMTSVKMETSQYTDHMLCVIGKKTFMNYSKNPFAKSKSLTESTAITMFGYEIAEEEALKEGIVHEQNFSFRFKQIKFMINELRGIEAKLQLAQTSGDEIQVETEGDSLTLFLSGLRLISGLRLFLTPMTAAAMATSMYNVIALNILKNSQGEKRNTPELMILLSRLLRSDYMVESVQIPKELTALSNSLRKDPAADCFKQMTPDEALEWLENDDSEAAREFRCFKARNSHRCYKEFDIQAKTWDICPILLVETLQSNVRSEVQPSLEKESPFMTTDQLPRQPGFMQKRLLNYFIKKAQFAVFIREATKSGLVKLIHRLRSSMRKLGLQLQAEGKLADPELLFFFTCDELYRFITTRDPSLLPRAIRRQKMHPILDRERFPPLLHGMPKPVRMGEGAVTGPARIVKDFSTEAHLIERGDILITRATDTGWTPYFPLLAGVVTEIGGLLSHGAVVAREYGLPAIVGIPGVTEFVKSGDTVTLDGNNGLLIRSPVLAHNASPSQVPVAE